MRDLKALPKAHLHLHLEGAMRPTTLTEMAAGYGVEVPAIRGYGSFGAFAGLYDAAAGVLRTEDDLRRVTREVVEDAAAAGAVWVEPQFYPPHHAEKLGDDAFVTDVVLDEGLATAARLGIGFGLMLSADRTTDPAEAVTLAKLAVTRRDRGMVSFGLANDEVAGPPEPYAEAFRIAREGGLLSTPHAGELAGPESVRGALDTLGPSRLAHGVRAIEDADLVKRLADEQICLDVCPTSNLLLAVVPSLEVHPLRALLDAGVPCSLNGDDPLLFGPGLLEEYDLARGPLGLDDEHLARIASSSIRFSGAPEKAKLSALTGVDAWLASP